MFKKIIISIVLASFIFVNAGVYFAQPARAQESTWYHQEWAEWYARVYDPETSPPDEIFGERYTAAQVEWVIYGLMAFVVNVVFGGSSLPGCIIGQAIMGSGDWGACLVFLDDTLRALGLIANAQIESNSALATKNPIQDIISGSRPISGISYLKGAVSKFNPVGEVSAQGFGFGAANSMRSLWVAVRNVTYFFLILMIIGMAFLVMFRFKINPQTVITIQSALPKIIIALILITFSYAIAGFMIDLMYVVIGLIAAILTSATPPLFDLRWDEMYNHLTGARFGQGVFGTLAIYIVIYAITSFITIWSNLSSFTNIIFVFLMPIILIVLLIALLFIAVKIMWMLIKTFVSVLLLIVVGPIYIITGGFTGWLKNLASNLAVFVAIGPMFAISYLFLGAALPVVDETEIFFNTLSGVIPFSPQVNIIRSSPWAPPFLGLDSMNLVWLFASFIVMTLVPNVANMIKSAVAGKPFGYGTAIGAAIGGAAGVAWYPFGQSIGSAKEAFFKDRGQRILEATRGALSGIRLPRRSA